MAFKLLLFSFGVISFSYCPTLISLWWILALPPLALVAFFKPSLWYVFSFCAGLAWGLWAGHHAIQQQLPADWDGHDFIVTGQVAGLPEQDSQRLRFDFRVTTVSTAQGEAIPIEHFPHKLQLSWYVPRGYGVKNGAEVSSLPSPAVGEPWQLHVRLKRPRGFVNPAGFDYHLWLLRQGIGATGYILMHEDNSPASKSLSGFRWDDWINQQRSLLQQWVMQQSNSSERGILVALLIGDSALVDKPQWQRMQQTGTSHLIAISGLHVGFLALFGFYLGLLLGKCVQLMWHACPALAIAWLCAIGCAAFYAALAGFNIPTVRTLIMLSLFYAACLARRTLRISDIFCWALALIVLLDPFAAYDMGFWLSFGAVGLLLVYFSGRLINKDPSTPWTGFALSNMVSGFLRSQWVMFIGLILPLSLLVNTVSLVAPLANAIAIPLITFFVVPLLLVGAAVGDSWIWLGNNLLALAAGAMEWLARFLDALLVFAGSWASPIVAFSPWSLLLLVLSVVAMMAPRGLFPRALAVTGLLIIGGLNFIITPPLQDDLKVSFMDVGQGMAVVVQVGARTLVYDTGPRYTAEFDAGSAIVAPYLFSQGIRQVDYLVVSHWDADHAGGVKGLLEKIPVSSLVAGERPRASHGIQQPVHTCHGYQAWRWAEVEFRFLEVPERARNNANNHSCVLLIRYGTEQIMLPGDIETPVEYRLLFTGQIPEAVTLIAAAHHGSRTSSGAPWVEHIRPRYVVYSAGYRNQHGHPHPQVQARYQAVGSEAITTAETGAAVFRWRSGKLTAVELQRQRALRYWYKR